MNPGNEKPSMPSTSVVSENQPPSRTEARAEVHAEHDKLGPLESPRDGTGEPRTGDLRATLLEGFRAAIADAQAAARQPALAETVHALRKALRRARATVHLVRDSLARDDRRDLTRALAQARQLLSTTRDLDVAPGVIATVQLDAGARATAEAIVGVACADAPPSDEVRRRIEDAAARVADLADLMAAALPPTLELGDARDGLAATYRRARQSLRRARRSRPAFHRFRKRTKELTLQLELLAGDHDGRTGALRRKLVALGDELGATVDVVMLRGLLDSHAGATSPDDLATLLAAVDADLDARIKASRRRARALFARGPRRFGRKVRRAMRRDRATAVAEAAAPAVAPA